MADDAMARGADALIDVDLDANTVTTSRGEVLAFSSPARLRAMLLGGLDEIDLTLTMRQDIDAFRGQDEARATLGVTPCRGRRSGAGHVGTARGTGWRVADSGRAGAVRARRWTFPGRNCVEVAVRPPQPATQSLSNDHGAILPASPCHAPNGCSTCCRYCAATAIR